MTMDTLSYNIDKDLSLESNCLAVRIQSSFNGSLSSNKFLQIESNKETANFLMQQEIAFQTKIVGKKNSEVTSFNTIHISYPKTKQALQLLAGTGKLHFNQRKIVCDLYSKDEFYYIASNTSSNKTQVNAWIKSNQKDFPLSECDFICAGPPHWYIKGIVLKFIGTDILWKDLKQAFYSPETVSKSAIQEAYDEDPENSPKIIFEGNAQHALKIESAPTPVLVLKDRQGSFADLWLSYDAGHENGQVKTPFHSTSLSITNSRGVAVCKRQPEEEKNWEKDLLETNFIKKLVGTSHYYCPLENVSKSLTFLLEVGWEVMDSLGNRVVRQDDMALQFASNGQGILIKGKVKYQDFTANVQDVVGAFNRKDRFVQLGSGVVGLLPNSLESVGLKGIAEEGEIVSDGIRVNRNRFGSLVDIVDSPNITLDKTLQDLKAKLQSLQHVEESLPTNEFKGQLRHYQQECLNWLSFLYDNGFHGLLADDMGLGKTVEVLSFLSRIRNSDPILIVMPTSLIFNWQREIERFLPSYEVLIHHGPMRSKEEDILKKAHIILTSYTTLRLDLSLFTSIRFNCIILDEAQNIKNAQTQIAQSVCRLNGNFRLSLTGTPIENHLSELWSHFRFLIPDLLNDEKMFLAEVQSSSLDPRHLTKIRKKIRPFLLRRTKEQVAKDLPEKIEQVVWVEMSPGQRQIYDDFLAGVKGNLFKKVELDGVSKHRMEILEAILRLRQICCHPLLVLANSEEASGAESSKLEALLQDIETAIEEGRKVLVYSQFTTMLKLIAREVSARSWNFAYLDGSTTNREKVVSQFQTDPATPLFLISLKAGGVGLNLTSADYVFLYDPWWNDAVENQAIDRAHRIGRKETVIAKRYVTIESIEEKIMRLKSVKRSIITDIMDDNLSHLNLTLEDFQFLLS